MEHTLHLPSGFLALLFDWDLQPHNEIRGRKAQLFQIPARWTVGKEVLNNQENLKWKPSFIESRTSP